MKKPKKADFDAGADDMQENTETEGLMPIMPANEEEADEYQPDDTVALPILTLRNTVLFPGVIIPITVGRKRSVRLVKDAKKNGRLIGVVTQRQAQADNPGPDDLYGVGTVARVLKQVVLPDGNTTVIIQGRQKFEIQEFLATQPYLQASLRILKEDPLPEDSPEGSVLLQSIRETAAKIIRINPDIPQEAQVAIDNIETSGFLIYFLASNLNISSEAKQDILSTADGMERGGKLLGHLLQELRMLEIKSEIHHKANSDIDQQQRDYFLRQQMRVLQDELGDGTEEELERLRARGRGKQWPEAVAKHFDKELNKLGRIQPSSPEYGIHLNYCEFLADLPWGEMSEERLDLPLAQEILDRDHHGLEKVKERILEYLAVLKLKQDMRGPILCFYGPPGVGKTSLGKSIAEALGRPYVRMSLGGMRDEAELRGHRKTYIGAMPGRVLQLLKKAGASNPVFVLDEIDKLSSDFRGDPSSALLEILDPEQNNAFSDNYLEVDYDLSKVFFIATANSLESIQPALRDRMEIIEVSGYTQEEKLEIAKRHLLPKQRKAHGLLAKHFSLPDASLQHIVDGYTRESGVRSLEREIGSVARRVAKSVAMEEQYAKNITAKRVEEILGPPKFDKELYQDNRYAGLVTGLAWTSVGGEILFVESSLSRGRGVLTLSGQLGDVMKESAVAAHSYLKAHAGELGIDERLFSQYDLHVHVPAGAVPKDGPSAGITLLTSMASTYTQRKVKRALAMTGEITLRGKVLPVGGIQEKLLAAKRAGIEEILLSHRNQKDLKDIPKRYLEGLEMHFVDDAREVLALALLPERVERPVSFVLKEERQEAS
jgi:ATP-dependent Lon protease